MHTAATDFRLLWDDAYRFHHLSESRPSIPNMLDECAQAGNPDRAFVFASTSKISFAGSGLAALAASTTNIAWWQRHASVRSIGPDKLNQLRHVRYLKDRAHVESLMEQHRQLLQPKFEAVHAQFSQHLSGMPKRTVALAKELGIVLTDAGAAFPYSNDPQDKHIRIAPSFPSLSEITLAAEGVALALRVATLS